MNIVFKKPLVYVTRDIERALGMEPTGSYFVISNDSAYGRSIKAKYPSNVELIGASGYLDTYDLLLRDEVQKKISTLDADIIVFQNTSRIERLAKEKGWRLLNPSASLAKEVEEKISQVRWLKEDANLLPRHVIGKLSDIDLSSWKFPFVLQFNHAHTGEGTYIIESGEKIAELRSAFPNRECKIVEFIDGPIFTINAVVADEIIAGNPSYQITGLKPFTDLPFSTIGNDWGMPQHGRFKDLRMDIVNISQKIGSRLKDAGWRGLFGIDVVFDETKGRTHLLEINSRQPASAVYESILEKEATPDALSIFDAHIASLLSLPLPHKSVSPIAGSQIVKRATEKRFEVDIDKMRRKQLTVIEYDNAAHNKELFRIQARAGIMESHNKLGELGIFIESCIK